MRKMLLIACLLGTSAQAGLKFGLQVGVYSPTTGIEDADNGILLGGDLWFKFVVIGVKVEAFYVDSSGRLEELGSGFTEANLDVKSMLCADIMWFPFGTTVFAQGGVNLTNFEVSNIDQEVIDNEMGLELGAGVSLFDKLLIQGKILYTPNAIQDDALSTIEGLDDENVRGYMVSVGWHF